MAKNEDAALEMALNAANKDLNNSASRAGISEANSLNQLNKLEAKRKSLVNVYRAEEKIPVTISPFYAPYLGRVVRESVNGIIVDIPADGQTYKVNKTHANHIIAKIKRIDEMLAHQKRVGDVENNFEHAPGELHL